MMNSDVEIQTSVFHTVKFVMLAMTVITKRTSPCLVVSCSYFTVFVYSAAQIYQNQNIRVIHVSPIRVYAYAYIYAYTVYARMPH